MDHIKTLNQLNDHIDEFNTLHYPDSLLKPIVGGGKKHLPKVMFVFINPTKRNLASHPDWTGQRVPWVGISTIWKVFAQGGIISEDLFEQIIEIKKDWTPQFTNYVYSEVEKSSIYITNIVKWAGEDAALPEKSKVERYLPILNKEIELVQPKHIVCFGMIPYQGLISGKSRTIKIGDVYHKSTERKQTIYEELVLPNHICIVSVCYFPVGMGRFHEKEAIELLKLVKIHCQLV